MATSMPHWTELRRERFPPAHIVGVLWRSKPPIDVEGILRDAGVVVQGGPLGEEISGSLEFTESSAVMIVNSGEVETRRRFTLAVLFGHLLQDPPGRYERKLQAPNRSPAAQAAHEFASLLLLPPAQLATGGAVLDKASLARRFNVSEAAAQAALTRLQTAVDPRVELGIPPSASNEEALAEVVAQLEKLDPARVLSLGFPETLAESARQQQEAILQIWAEARLFDAMPFRVRFDRFGMGDDTPEPEDVVDQLWEARRLLVERGWCRGGLARSSDGRKIVAHDGPRAFLFSASGAISRVTQFPEPRRNLKGVMDDLLCHVLGLHFGGLADWNDGVGRTRDEVVAALERAIEAVRLPPQSLPPVPEIPALSWLSAAY